MAEQRSCITTENSVPKGKRSSICWGDLEIYEFPNILGDNPATSDGGAPITIGWKHESKSVVAIDYYEFLRQSHPRRKRKELAVSGGQRDTYLLGLGYRLDELLEASEECKLIRKSRQANMKGRFENFRKVFNITTKPLKTVPRIVAGKSA